MRTDEADQRGQGATSLEAAGGSSSGHGVGRHCSLFDPPHMAGGPRAASAHIFTGSEPLLKCRLYHLSDYQVSSDSVHQTNMHV